MLDITLNRVVRDPDNFDRDTLIEAVHALGTKLATYKDADEDRIPKMQRVFGLTPKEAKMLDVLLDGRVWRKTSFMDLLYTNEIDEPEIKIIDVFICKLRNKLTGTGVLIDTVWGTGYQLKDPELVKAILADSSNKETGAARQVIEKKPQWVHNREDHPVCKLKNHLRELCLASHDKKIVTSWSKVRPYAPELSQLSGTLRHLEGVGLLKCDYAGRERRGPDVRWVVGGGHDRPR